MITGLIDGLLSGLYTVVFDSGELTSPADYVEIPDLDGDVDGEYELIVRGVSGASSNSFFVRLNADTGSNYGIQHLRGESTSVLGGRQVLTNWPIEFQGLGVGHIGFSRLHLFARSGNVRLMQEQCVDQVNGSVITDMRVASGSWNNTSDKLTSITVHAQQTNGLGVGSRVILLKKVDELSGLKSGGLDIKGMAKNTWQLVERRTVSTPVQNLSFSGLDGNADVIYNIVGYFVAGITAAVSYVLRPNNDSGSNYGNQFMKAAATSPSAARVTSATFITMGGTNNVDSVSLSNVLLYAKSGYVRTAIARFNDEVNGSNVNEIWELAAVWNNTVSNITSLMIDGLSAGAIGAGSQVELWKLNL